MKTEKEWLKEMIEWGNYRKQDGEAWFSKIEDRLRELEAAEKIYKPTCGRCGELVTRHEGNSQPGRCPKIVDGSTVAWLDTFLLLVEAAEAKPDLEAICGECGDRRGDHVYHQYCINKLEERIEELEKEDGK
jgi:hypothetical protein